MCKGHVFKRISAAAFARDVPFDGNCEREFNHADANAITLRTNLHCEPNRNGGVGVPTNHTTAANAETSHSLVPAFDDAGFRQHLAELGEQWQKALAEERFDAAVIPAGEAEMYFQDDQAPPFHPNPHFARWLPTDECERSVLLVYPGEKPKLHFLQASDYWHLPATAPEWADESFDVQRHADGDGLREALAKDIANIGRFALVGPANALDLNLTPADINPPALTSKLMFARARKTPFEVARMVEATEVGVRGHLAAKDAFHAGGSEFDIHMAYLTASSQQESKLPYPSIVALNEHAGVLHYQHYDRARPPGTRSFLIDAGGRSHSYHSDITRTYSAAPGDDFDALISAMDEHQQALAAAVRPGTSYIDLQERMHRAVADLLVRFDFVRCSAESAFDLKITDAFIPHGLGHLLGLQTHDVGGQLASADGQTAPAPERFPTLRYTRSIEAGHVITVEPGIYFIPMLLDALADTTAGAEVNWPKVRAFLPCGGIRIEDNVVVGEDATTNLTRTAFAKLT